MLASLIVGLLPRTSSVLAACYDPTAVCGSDMPSTCEPDLIHLLPHLDINDYCVENRNILFKTGLVDGSLSTGDSSIDSNFLFCWESFTDCGRVILIKSVTSSGCGQPWDDGTSPGVKIGGGLDLGKEDIASLTALGASTGTLAAFSNYVGLQLWAAAEAVCATPLSIDVAEAYALTVALIDRSTQEMETVYNAEKAADALPFNELPLGIKTVLVSIEYKWGHSFNAQFWEYIKVNDFEGAVYELLNFHGDGVSSARLRSEANVMTASLGCVGNIDCVFLVDESGSVSEDNFDLTLDWIAEFVDSFDESRLDQTDINIGTRFGVATFASTSTDEFFLNSYATTAEYTDHILAIAYNGGGTYLGAALTQIGVSQFTELSGMRPASVGMPRLLIVLTDGMSSDDVVAGVATLDGLNLHIIAIGIDGYDITQLEDITSNDKIYTIDAFTQLSTILDGVMTQTCYVPTQLTIGDIIEDVSTEEGLTKYFQFETSGDIDQNTVLNIHSTQGCVYVFVSYCSQYPSYYVNDVQFTSCGQPSKQIILSETLADCSEYDTVFVAFEGRSAVTAIFNMTVDVCDAVSCAVGTNYDESLNNDGPYDISEVVIETSTVTPTETSTGNGDGNSDSSDDSGSDSNGQKASRDSSSTSDSGSDSNGDGDSDSSSDVKNQDSGDSYSDSDGNGRSDSSEEENGNSNNLAEGNENWVDGDGAAAYDKDTYTPLVAVLCGIIGVMAIVIAGGAYFVYTQKRKVRDIGGMVRMVRMVGAVEDEGIQICSANSN